jgi:hypothetical protein
MFATVDSPGARLIAVEVRDETGTRYRVWLRRQGASAAPELRGPFLARLVAFPSQGAKESLAMAILRTTLVKATPSVVEVPSALASSAAYGRALVEGADAVETLEVLDPGLRRESAIVVKRVTVQVFRVRVSESMEVRLEGFGSPAVVNTPGEYTPLK